LTSGGAHGAPAASKIEKNDTDGVYLAYDRFVKSA